MEEKQEFLNTDMTAGEMLKIARTTGRRKREIATIAKLLCIKEEFLTALEEGNYRVIPEDVYILGFARSYAVELGLNPDEIILKLKHELGIIQEPKEEEIEVKNVVQKQSIKKINKEDLKRWFSIGVNYVKKHWIWFSAGLFVFILMIVLLVTFSGKQTVVPQETSNDVIKVAVASTDPEFRYPVHERFEEKNRSESRVVLQAEKESWLRIEDAKGNTVFARVLAVGDVYYMPNIDTLKASFNNVGAFDVWVDGQLLNKLGPANTKKTSISMSVDALKTVGFAE